MLEIYNLTAGYGDAIVIEDLSLSLQENKSLAVLGRNGVGKSTLMMTLAGHTRQTGGRILWRGRDISAQPPSERARLGIGWVPQERNIFHSLTVEENLRVAATSGFYNLEKVYGVFPRLHERRRNMGDKLSGGEQQMLAIGRALMTNPKLLLLDEPFEGLAPVIVEELEATLSRLRREDGFATLLVEQRAEDALRLSDDAIVLDRGRIVESGSAEHMLNDISVVQKWIAV
ncbi:ABC transporter ATP-binding protein [Variovorax sp. J2P1-59]|uniref:ABC transporter ATP-binding protein n=1 Tax=Variovorax flavidus TaxID=3053501 RepID=UPI002574FCFC|nr:ABC transporter ATP-binding protein [Variovorax sp. J2P1-59]MDM0078132.1 ABC transporter ATP-binding protein [Variovorax sp. J2P1-59]